MKWFATTEKEVGGRTWEGSGGGRGDRGTVTMPHTMLMLTLLSFLSFLSFSLTPSPHSLTLLVSIVASFRV